MTDHLTDAEKYWQGKQPWLQSRGYQLRPRYRPGWIPSWIDDPPLTVDSILGPWEREDYLGPQIMDAVRLKDDAAVMLKKVHTLGNRYDQEAEISLYLSSPKFSEDPQNHCVPLYEMLQIPGDDDSVILVMPLLRPFTSPRFDTIGECMYFFRQIFQGLWFLHRNNIAHRDCTGPNLMMDGSELYPDGFHPRNEDLNREHTGPANQVYTRTQLPPKYYWIDFGKSARFHQFDPSRRITPHYGTDKSVPEFRNPNSHIQKLNPCPTDVYYLGNLLRMYFTEGDTERDLPGVYGLDFLKPLIDDMVQDDPERRPTMEQCVELLDDIICGLNFSLSSWSLRSQVWYKDDDTYTFGTISRLLPHWARRITYIINQTPAMELE